jgi:streptogramin lyase
MSKKTGRLLTATLAVGIVLSMGSAALAAPVAMLKQFKVPTARSEPRAITNGSDGNVWFTEGTSFTNAPPKIGRVTPGGAITEFGIDCNGCILTDIVQGPNNILYMTSNNPILVRFNWSTGTQLPSIDIPSSSAVAGDMDIRGNEIWFNEFNNDSLWRYNITSGAFTQFLLAVQPSDVAIDSAGDVWFTSPDDQSVKKFNPGTGTVVASFTATDGLTPRQIAIATDGQIWFTSRFTPQGVGRVNPTTGVVTTFPTPSNPGPEDIAAGPGGAIWFTQTTMGNVARIDNAGVITEGKAVKGSGPLGIVVAPNGDPWYAMTDANKIATLQLR